MSLSKDDFYFAFIRFGEKLLDLAEEYKVSPSQRRNDQAEVIEIIGKKAIELVRQLKELDGRGS